MTAELRVSDIAIKGGRHLRVNETGTPGQPALLFLHGSGPGVTAASNWREVLLGLGDTYHCVAPDILGFGDSSYPDPQPQGFAAQAEVRIEALLELVDALGLEKVVLVGNSMGGMYSLRIAQLRPELVDRIILMGSGGMPGLAPAPGLIKLITYFDDPTVEAMADLLIQFVHDKSAFGDKVEEVAAERMPIVRRPWIEEGHRAMFAPEMLTFAPEELAEIDLPTLVVHGRQDVIVPIECSYYLAENLPQADLYVMNKCGHWTQIEQAARFQAIVRDFVPSGR
ncbi:2-hydroxymuconate semialdehyde hydrolase [Actinocorallia herbida]|uniref:2-hydroxymuconate semialdehyde hydrolase n=1 Tax=Actinocorallia herbida TaxID=58109 RepID=A0A3N1CWF0_9ACTN|nr:alpha/beta hydrolase [Actinocorallia herbida]ROO85611.1 2-hydroxymuconate semialdehyde hydrolase [Actinocorallia herbida]